MSQAFSPRWASARAVGTETPKRSTAQGSVDVAPSLSIDLAPGDLAQQHHDGALHGRLLAEEPIEAPAISSLDKAAAAPMWVRLDHRG